MKMDFTSDEWEFESFEDGFDGDYDDRHEVNDDDDCEDEYYYDDDMSGEE
jgi:hypothetical protein